MSDTTKNEEATGSPMMEISELKSQTAKSRSQLNEAFAELETRELISDVHKDELSADLDRIVGQMEHVLGTTITASPNDGLSGQPRNPPADGYYTAKQRLRIVRDIAHWREELSQTGGEELPPEAFRDFVQELYELTDPELAKRWDGTVGEWAASRGDLPWPAYTSVGSYLDVQFGKLIAGHETDYGFVVSISVPKQDEVEGSVDG